MVATRADVSRCRARSGHSPQPWCWAWSTVRSPAGTDACELSGKVAGCPEGARTASGGGARGLPVLRGSSPDGAVARSCQGGRNRWHHSQMAPQGLAQKEEEDMKEKKAKEQAAETRRRAQALMGHAASLPKGKRKKKRKRKLPRSGYKFLPRSRRPFGTNSSLVLRVGGHWLLRSNLAASCHRGSLQAQDARHLGRYGPEGHLCRDTETASVSRAVRT